MTAEEALQRKAMLALKKAVRGVIERHKQTGRPLAVWRKGKVVRLSPYRVSRVVGKQPPQHKEKRHG